MQPEKAEISATYTDQFGIEFILVEGGSFEMGSEEEDDEKPIHTVFVDSFYMGKYPVTQAQYAKIMRANPSRFKGESRPVENVSWLDAQAFIKKTQEKAAENGQSLTQYRLPTEAQWEYAASGGNKSKGFKYAGCSENKIADYAWYAANSYNSTQPVGEKKPNELGISYPSRNVR